MDKGGTVIALGMFDGVHMGHRRLLERALGVSELDGLDPMVYTFSNAPAKTAKSILSREESFLRIRGAGIPNIAADEFTPALRDTEPEDFLKMLITRFSMKAVVVGFNYTFGRARRGTAASLAQYGRDMGFCTYVLPGVVHDGELVSSTSIRTLIEEGRIERANVMLSEPYSVSGVVAQGKRIGRAMGFPTANITGDGLMGRVLPAFGVYAATARISGDDRVYTAVTNVGDNPTVGGSSVTVETHLLDFSGELYGREIRVEFLKELRGQVQFSGRDELSAQIARDVQNTRNYFEKRKIHERA